MTRTAVSLLLLLCPVSAFAQSYPYVCCDSIATPNGACTASEGACQATTGYGIQLWNPETGANEATGIDYSAVSYPAGQDATMFWQMQAPWFGVCLVAPNPQDPTHVSPTEPVGCLSLRALPTLRASAELVQVPNDPRWDAYELCYGSATATPTPDGGLPLGESPDFGPFPLDGGGEGYCVFPDDLGGDNGIVPTFSSNSCCGPAQMLSQTAALVGSEWQIAVDEALPGVLPPQYPDDGGCAVPWIDGGVLPGYPDGFCPYSIYPPFNWSECVTPDCWQPVADAGFCMPTTCDEQHETCSVISDGCGGTLNCASDCSTKGACSVSAPAAPASGTAIGAFVALSMLARRRRRA